MNLSNLFRQPSKVLYTLCAVSALVLTNTEALAADPQQEKPRVAIAIHGGAGTILKSSMTPEQEADYKRVLTQAVQHGYELLKDGKKVIGVFDAATDTGK